MCIIKYQKKHNSLQTIYIHMSQSQQFVINCDKDGYKNHMHATYCTLTSICFCDIFDEILKHNQKTLTNDVAFVKTHEDVKERFKTHIKKMNMDNAQFPQKIQKHQSLHKSKKVSFFL